MSSTHVLAAKMIRQEFKKLGLKASVRSSSYAGGSSINISTEDLSPAQLDQVREIGDRFQMGGFDGMNDIYELSNHRDDIPQVKYVLYSNAFTVEMKQSALNLLLTKPLNGLELGEIPAKFTDVRDYKQLEYINSILFGNNNYLSDEFWNNQNLAQAA